MAALNYAIEGRGGAELAKLVPYLRLLAPSNEPEAAKEERVKYSMYIPYKARSMTDSQQGLPQQICEWSLAWRVLANLGFIDLMYSHEVLSESGREHGWKPKGPCSSNLCLAVSSSNVYSEQGEEY